MVPVGQSRWLDQKLARRTAWLLTVLPPGSSGHDRHPLDATPGGGAMQRDLGMVVGVDTHKDSHSAALVDAMGALVAATDVGANRKGYRRLLEWARCRGPQRTWVVEGTGSYGQVSPASWLQLKKSCSRVTGRSAKSPARPANQTSWTPSRWLAKPSLGSTTRFHGSGATER